MAGPATPFVLNAAGIDLSPRVQRNATVVASPSGSAETIVASITVSGNLGVASGIIVYGFGAFTVGTNGVSVNLKLRQTDASGSTLKATGAVTFTAANLGALSVIGFDASPSLPGQVYVMTATVASGSAASTFSAVEIGVIVL